MIEDKHDKFDELLGDKLSSMSEMPSEGLWDRIEATLAAMEQSAVVAPVEPKRVPLWSRSWVRISAAVAAAVALFVGVVTISEQSAPEELVSSVAAEISTTEENVIEPAEPATPNVEQVLAAATPKRLATTPSPKSTDIVAAIVPVEEQEAATIEEATEIVATATQKATATNKSVTKRSGRRSQRKSATEIEEYWRAVMDQEQEPTKGISLLPSEVKLYANNLGFDQGHIQVKNISQSAMLMSESNVAGNDATLVGNPTFMKTQRKETSELKHFMPISVGLSASFALNDWLSVESGLSYTNLYSSSDNTGKVSTYHYTQNLHYIGVPLAASVRFIDIGNLSLYAKAGATAEVCVAANNRLYIDKQLNLVQKIDTEGLNIGLNAAAGVNYGIWNNLGLFAEAGVAYWSATKPQPTNYRTEHPLGFSFMAGLRLSFQ